MIGEKVKRRRILSGAPERNAPPTREKILSASVEVFGRLGYGGATVRAITDAAGANVQAIAYYFGGKEGLYLATADYLAERMQAIVRESIADIGPFLDDAPGAAARLDKETAAGLLREILRHLIAVMLRPDLKPLAQFMVREQMDRTDGFARIYEAAIGPLLNLCARLVAILRDDADHSGRRVRLRTFSLLGSVLAFRVGYATLLRQLDKNEVGAREKRNIDELVDELVRSLDAKEPDR